MAKDKNETAEAAAKPELTPEEAAAKGKKKKMLIFVIAGVVATTGIGGGLAVFLSKSDAPTGTTVKTDSVETAAHVDTKKDDAKKDEPKKDEAKKDEGKEGKKDEKAEVKMPQGVDIGCTHQFKSFNLNLGNPLENRYIRLELAVEHGCADEDKNELKGREPQLRDAIIGVISKKTREFLLSPDGKAQLTHEIRNQINQRMSRPIKDVYITDILIE